MPNLASTTRHIAPGITVVGFSATLVAANMTPTRAEITASTILTNELLDWNGWSVEGAVVQSRSVGTRRITGVSGMKTLTESSLTFNADRAGVDARTLFVDGLTGFIWFMDGGDVAASLMDVFKVEVNNTQKVRAADGGSLNALMVQFAINAWEVNRIIPATV